LAIAGTTTRQSTHRRAEIILNFNKNFVQGSPWMKFGKRLSSWISQHSPEVYFDYALFKRALADDVHLGQEALKAGDALTTEWSCDRVLQTELQAFSVFVDAKTAAFEVRGDLSEGAVRWCAQLL